MKKLLFFLPVLLLLFLSQCGQTQFRQGEALYVTHCANCHMETGAGLGELIPPLANSDYLRDNNLLTACHIRYGMAGPIIVNDTTYNNVMTAIIEDDLSDFQVVNVMNYINHAWGNDYGVVSLQGVQEQLTKCPPVPEE